MHISAQRQAALDLPEGADLEEHSRADTYNQGERNPAATTAARIKNILNILNFDIKKPRLVKPPDLQKLRGSLGWVARVIILEGPSVSDYMAQIKQTQLKCQQILKEKDSFTHTDSSGHKTNHGQCQSQSNQNQQQISTHEKTVDSSQQQAKRMPTLFPTFPEALHKPEPSQCMKFNSELMKKIVFEKRRNNHKFQDGKCMHDAFKFFARPELQNAQQAAGSNSIVVPQAPLVTTPVEKKE